MDFLVPVTKICFVNFNEIVRKMAQWNDSNKPRPHHLIQQRRDMDTPHDRVDVDVGLLCHLIRPLLDLIQILHQ